MTHTDTSAAIATSAQTSRRTDSHDAANTSAQVNSHPTANIWACLTSPINRVDAAQALLGLDVNSLRQLGAAEMLTAPVAGHLLDNGPRILEQPGFPHNHLELAGEVAAGLKTLNAVGSALESIPRWAYDDENLRHARGAYARSTALAAHSAFHEPAVQARASERRSKPFGDAALGLSTLLPLVDQRTEHQHRILLTMLSLATEVGIRPDVEIDEGIAHCGRIAFRHCRNRGADEASGIRVGSLLFGVSDYRGQPTPVALERLNQRAKGLRPVLVNESIDLSAHEAAIKAELTKSAHI